MILNELPSPASRVFTGQGVSPGLAIGKAFKLDKRRLPIFRLRIPRARIPQELERLYQGIERSKQQIGEIRKRLGQQVGEQHAYILEAQLLMIEDRVLLAEVSEVIRGQLVNAEWAVKSVTDKYLHAYRSLTEEYYRERGCDLADIRTRLITNIAGESGMDFTLFPGKMVLFSEEVEPSMIAAVDYRKVQAFVSEQGGWTSHTAILARSLGIPAVVGLDDLLGQVNSGETVAVDGEAGKVILSPSKEVLREYYHRRRLQRKPSPLTGHSSKGKLLTIDGQRIFLQANTELTHEIGDVLTLGVDGVGLFRSEFLLLQSKTGMPTEDEQFEAFKQLALNSAEQAPAVRIFDIGAEKFAGTAGIKNEVNPALGLRGIRLCLKLHDFFMAHLRAILRASAFGRLRIVIPFVSDLGEVRETRRLLSEAMSQLGNTDSSLQLPPLGIMIELPSAVNLIMALARESDFLCIGTNDLIQYTMAVDRTNRNVASLFQPLHPAVLQNLWKIIEAGQQFDRAITLCGEAACEPLFAYFAIGMGITHFSINRTSIPRLKEAIPHMLFAEAQMMAKEILRLEEIDEVRAFLRAHFGTSASSLKQLWHQEWEKALA